MATLYFNAALSNDWNLLGNWWQNLACDVQASGLPGASDDVVLLANCTANSGSEPSVRNLQLRESYVILDIPVTVSEYVLVLGAYAAIGGSSTVSGTCRVLFVGEGSGNNGDIPNACFLGDYSSNANSGSIAGKARFLGVWTANYGYTSGDAEFVGFAAFNEGQVAGDCALIGFGSGLNPGGQVDGNLYLIGENSYSAGTVTGTTKTPLYFNVLTPDDSWDLQSAWYTDAALTTNSLSFPANDDAVVIVGTCITGGTITPNVKYLVVRNDDTNVVTGSLGVSDITVSGLCVLEGLESTLAMSCGLTGDVVAAGDYTGIYGNVTGDFYATGLNAGNAGGVGHGSAEGLAVFHGEDSYQAGIVNGDAVFTGYGSWCGGNIFASAFYFGEGSGQFQLTGSVSGRSEYAWTGSKDLSGDVYLSDGCPEVIVSGDISISLYNAIFYGDMSSVSIPGSIDFWCYENTEVTGTMVAYEVFFDAYSGPSYNTGTIQASSYVQFQYGAYNDGTVTAPSVLFDGGAINSGTINGDTTMTGQGCYHYGTINGDLIFSGADMVYDYSFDGQPWSGTVNGSIRITGNLTLEFLDDVQNNTPSTDVTVEEPGSLTYLFSGARSYNASLITAENGVHAVFSWSGEMTGIPPFEGVTGPNTVISGNIHCVISDIGGYTSADMSPYTITGGVSFDFQAELTSAFNAVLIGDCEFSGDASGAFGSEITGNCVLSGVYTRLEGTTVNGNCLLSGTDAVLWSVSVNGICDLKDPGAAVGMLDGAGDLIFRNVTNITSSLLLTDAANGGSGPILMNSGNFNVRLSFADSLLTGML